MFNLKGLFGKTTALKNTDNNFFSELSKADTKVSENESSQSDKFMDLYNEGVEKFKSFVIRSNPNKSELEDIYKIFSEAISLKSTKSGPYLHLSYIYYILDNKPLSIKYLDIGKKLDSDQENIALITNLQNILS